MPYFQPGSLSLKQTTPEYASSCTVHVSWDYGNLDCDYVDVLWHPDLDQVGQYGNGLHDMPTNNGSFTSVDLPYVHAPGMVWIGVFPKVWDDEQGMLSYLPDDYGDESFLWFVHGIVRPLTTRSQPPDEQGEWLETPVLDDPPEIGPGTVRLTWSRPKGAEFYHLQHTRAGHTVYTRPAVTTEVLYRTRPGEQISAEVRAGHEDFWGSDHWSGWSHPIRFTIPDDAAYQPLAVTEVASIAAVRRGAGRTVVLAGDGRAHALTFTPALGYHTWQTIDGPGLDPAQPVSALSRSAPYVDAFTVVDDRIHLAWSEDDEWRAWQPLSDPRFARHGHVGVCTRASDFMDVFAVDLDGTLQGCWWNGNPWRGFYPLPGATFPPGAVVAAACRNDDVNEVWAVDENGEVRGRHWNGSWGDWFTLAGPLFPPGGWISAVAPSNDEMRLAAVDVDGVAQETRWDGDTGWQGWEPRPGIELEPGQCVALERRYLWAVDRYGALHRWLPSQQQWTVDREPEYFTALAAVDGYLHAVERTPLGGLLRVGRVDPLDPDSALSWWLDG